MTREPATEAALRLADVPSGTLTPRRCRHGAGSGRCRASPVTVKDTSTLPTRDGIAYKYIF